MSRQLLRLLGDPGTGARLHESLLLERPFRLVPRPLRNIVRRRLLPLSPPPLAHRFWKLLPVNRNDYSIRKHSCQHCPLRSIVSDPVDAVIAVLARQANPLPERGMRCSCFPQLTRWTRRSEAVLAAIVKVYNERLGRHGGLHHWDANPLFAAARAGSTRSLVIPSWVCSVWNAMFI